MNAFLKVALVGGAGLLAYEWYKTAASATTTTTSTPTNPSTPSVQNPATPPPGVLANNRAKIITAAGGSAAEDTFDQWNYYFQQVTGEAGPAPDGYVGAVGTPTRTKALTESQWEAFMIQAGFSGLGNYAAWNGRATPRNPFTATPLNPDWSGPF